MGDGEAAIKMENDIRYDNSHHRECALILTQLERV